MQRLISASRGSWRCFTLIHSHNLRISPIRNSDDRDRNRCFSLGALSHRRRDGTRGEMENRVERCTPTGVQAPLPPRGTGAAALLVCLLFIGWWCAKMKKDNVGLINDILNIRRGRWRKFSGLLQRPHGFMRCVPYRRNLTISCASSSE